MKLTTLSNRSTRFGFSLASLAVAALLPMAQAAKEVPEWPAMDELKTLKGKVYEKVKITGVDPDGLRISHDSGAAKVPFTQLPVAMQQQFGYNPEQATAFAEKEVKERVAREDEDRLARLRALSEGRQGEFQNLRKSFLEGILSGVDLAQLRATIEKQVLDYEASGDDDWVKLLKEDLELLKVRMTTAPPQDMVQRNRKLEQDIQSLRQELRTVSTTASANRSRTVVIPSSPFDSRSYVVPQTQYIPVPVAVPQQVPCPPVPHYHTPSKSEAGHFVPSGSLVPGAPMVGR